MAGIPYERCRTNMTENAIELRHADTDSAVAACFLVLSQLRPHLTDVATLVAQIGRQGQEGYRLLAAWRGGKVIGVAGYRLQENLIYGRFVYVDDLAVLDTERRGNIGVSLLDAVAAEAKASGCKQLILDTGLGNALAQRFYFRCGLLMSAFRFERTLE